VSADVRPTAESPEPAAPEPAAPGRAERKPRDLVLSLVVLLIPVLLLVGLFRALGHEDPPGVDLQPTLDTARASGFVVASPARLPDGWTPVAAIWADGTLRIGWQASDRTGGQLIESSQPAEQLLADELGAGTRPLGPVEIEGRTWQRYRSEPERNSLVLLEPSRTIVITGPTGPAELRELAEALH